MKIDEIIREAIKEDFGDGDHSSRSVFVGEAKGMARLIAKDHGVLCGVDVAREVYRQVDDTVLFEAVRSDGDVIAPGDVIFEVKGPAVGILSAERLALNFMQRLSGIATSTFEYVEAVKGFPAKILDTRKTTPLMRELEKYAVKTGGGQNHRFGLYDMIMIKDNHIDFAGGIPQAVAAVCQYMSKHGIKLPVEVETRNLQEVETVLSSDNVDRIMLDNFDVDTMRQAVKLVDHRIETEASGGITLDTVRQYAATGVDYISIGALTHHINSLDMSLKAVIDNHR